MRERDCPSFENAIYLRLYWSIIALKPGIAQTTHLAQAMPEKSRGKTHKIQRKPRYPALQRIPQGGKLRANGWIESVAHGVFNRGARRLIELVFLMVHFDRMAEPIGAHAVDAQTENRILDGGIAGYHHGFDAALARIAAQLLYDLVRRIPRS